jgi:hypothetical protein
MILIENPAVAIGAISLKENVPLWSFTSIQSQKHQSHLSELLASKQPDTWFILWMFEAQKNEHVHVI